MDSLPKISIVIPNYNGGATLGRTIQSLLNQQYPHLELIVVDGGSTDNSLEIIHQFEPHIAWWISEPDRGQSHAINKGLARATGQIVNWLGSDDYLLPDALRKVGREFSTHPEIDILVGTTWVEVLGSPQLNHAEGARSEDLAKFPSCAVIPQPGTFFRKKLLAYRNPPIDESFHYGMDTELWCLFWSHNAKWRFIEDHLAVFTMSGENKTAVGGMKIAREMERIYLRYSHDRIPLTFWHRLVRHPLEKLRVRYPGPMSRLILRPIQGAVTAFFAPFYGWTQVKSMNWRAYWEQECARQNK